MLKLIPNILTLGRLVLTIVFLVMIFLAPPYYADGEVSFPGFLDIARLDGDPLVRVRHFNRERSLRDSFEAHGRVTRRQFRCNRIRQDQNVPSIVRYRYGSNQNGPRPDCCLGILVHNRSFHADAGNNGHLRHQGHTATTRLKINLKGKRLLKNHASYHVTILVVFCSALGSFAG